MTREELGAKIAELNEGIQALASNLVQQSPQGARLLGRVEAYREMLADLTEADEADQNGQSKETSDVQVDVVEDPAPAREDQ